MRGLTITTLSATELHERMRGAFHGVVLDVRSESELVTGMLPSALHIPVDEIAVRAPTELDRQVPIVIYCASGIRSLKAAQALERLNYEGVAHLEGGIASWRDLGFPVVVKDHTQPLHRYSRQLLLPEIGREGQARLGRARALLVGVGGLGSPAALYLAGAGVGSLGLVDPDQVALSNLHRQIIHDTSRVGMLKVESARVRLSELNPEVQVKSYPVRFNSDNVPQIIDDGWDVIIDGADNFPTRYALNDAAVKYDLPLCHGSVDRFEGQVTTFGGARGPCYRCLFPRPPAAGTLGSCAERGVLGVLPGIIGMLQATEALKLLLGIGQPLLGRLLIYDALSLTFRQIRYTRNDECAVCGQPSDTLIERRTTT